MSVDEARPFFATAAKGSEGALRDELRELRLPRVRADRGGVHFGGELEHGMRACLRSRIALRVLLKVGRFHAPNPSELYAGAQCVDWTHYLDTSRTFAVSAHVRDSDLRHSGFAAQRVKDAVVDQLRQRTGARPDVNRDAPDVRLQLHLVRNEAELYVDLAGEPLHRRGYRTQTGDAPLKEHLAAAILRLAGWQPGTPVHDPLCGSGTFCIEAASWAAGLAAGGKRRFGFERLVLFDEPTRLAYARERERAEHFANPVATQVSGSDSNPDAITAARANGQRAGVQVRWQVADWFQAQPPPRGTFVVTNPPYGVRLERQPGWLAQFGRAVTRMAGCRVAVFSPERTLPQLVGRRPTLEHSLYNGNLDCRLFVWQLP